MHFDCDSYVVVYFAAKNVTTFIITLIVSQELCIKSLMLALRDKSVKYIVEMAGSFITKAYDSVTSFQNNQTRMI